ncbi:hypothetical protein BX600DRAFT_37180 [Xylariales sp. PMI_506]|nr:hypothetical protein BX600DRAFT_37180 [Xylariales sp. PMI_506]
MERSTLGDNVVALPPCKDPMGQGSNPRANHSLQEPQLSGRMSIAITSVYAPSTSPMPVTQEAHPFAPGRMVALDCPSSSCGQPAWLSCELRHTSPGRLRPMDGIDPPTTTKLAHRKASQRAALKGTCRTFSFPLLLQCQGLVRCSHLNIEIFGKAFEESRLKLLPDSVV